MKEGSAIDDPALVQSTLFALGPMLAKPDAAGDHRFRNELSVVLALLDCQRSARHDAAVRASLGWLEERVFTIADLHEFCLGFEAEAGVPFKALCEYLGGRIALAEPAWADRFTLVARGSEFSLDYEVALKLGLVIEELLHACLDHLPCADSAGIIRIELVDFPEGLLAFRVIDNGFRTTASRGADASKLALTKRLVEGLGGCFVIEDYEGTEVLALFERSRLLVAAEDMTERTGVDRGR